MSAHPKVGSGQGSEDYEYLLRSEILVRQYQCTNVKDTIKLYSKLIGATQALTDTQGEQLGRGLGRDLLYRKTTVEKLMVRKRKTVQHGYETSILAAAMT